MDWELETRSVAELERLRSLTAACRDGSAAPADDLHAALEHGFGWLIWLEASLGRSRDDTSAAARLAGLIEPLRVELNRLLALSRREQSSWRTQGFVLPAGS